MPLSPEFTLPPAFWIVVSVLLLLQLLTWITVLVQGGRIRRLEAKLLARNDKAASIEVAPASAPNAEEAGGGVHFRRFLDEDPSRKELSKKEQSAAFRKWRSQQGLNWDAKAD